MHPYTTDENRVRVYGRIAFVAVVLAWGVVALTSRFSWPQWLVSAPSVVGAYALIYSVVDRRLWRTAAMRRTGMVKVPDLSGTYDGSLVSVYKDERGERVKRDVSFTIKQTWTRISIAMEVQSDTSSSESISAVASVRSEGDATVLTYIYKNRVNKGIADDDMGDHEGAADLKIRPDGRMAGHYFNSRPRAGSITAARRASAAQ